MRISRSCGIPSQDHSRSCLDQQYLCCSHHLAPWPSVTFTSCPYRYRICFKIFMASRLHKLGLRSCPSVSSLPHTSGSTQLTLAAVGSFCGVLLCNFSLDRIYIHLRGPCDPKGQPEYRLPMLIVGAILLPAAVTFYGWIAHLRLAVSLLLLAVALLGFTIMLTIIPLSAYVVDAFGIYSASAMTGVIVIRCLMGTFLPLVTGPLADSLGYGPGFTCFGALSLSFAVLPMLIFRYGERWRQRSEFTCNN